MRRHLRVLIAGAAAMLAVSCRDGALAPTTEGLSPQGADALASLTAAGSSTTEFTINPEGSQVNLFGLFQLNFPRGSVCDPATSTYGPGQWDAPCTAATQPIRVTATLAVVNGRLYADFTPSLRFVPSSSQNRWVTISTNLYADRIKGTSTSARAALLRKLGILYAPYLGAVPQDEVVVTGDKSLQTNISMSTYTIWRRIKHFTGYNILTNLECTPSPDDPYCIEVDPNTGEPGEG